MENLTVKDKIIYLVKKEIGENMLGDYNEMYLTDLDVDHIAENLAETLTKKYKIEEKEITFSTLSFEPGYHEWLLKKDDEVIEVFGDFGEQIWPEEGGSDERENIEAVAQDVVDLVFADKKHEDLLPYKQDIYDIIVEGLTKYYL